MGEMNKGEDDVTIVLTMTEFEKLFTVGMQSWYLCLISLHLMAIGFQGRFSKRTKAKLIVGPLQ